jgi:sigma-B regulation protein RsbU (phosphoserine phosphatase)
VQVDPSPAGRELSFGARLVISMCGLVLVSSAVVLFISQRSASTEARTLANSMFREVSRHAATRSQAYVERAVPVVDTLRQLGMAGALALNDQDRLGAQLLSVLKANPGLSWVVYGDEQGRFTGAWFKSKGQLLVSESHVGVDGKSPLLLRDVMSDGTWQIDRRENDSGYDPRKRPYYIAAAALKHEDNPIAWVRPYVFYDQGVPGISCASPIYNSDGSVKGVFSADFTLNALSEFVASSRIGEHSTVFLFTDDRVLLAHPGTRLVEQQTRGEGELLTLADAGDPLVDAFSENIPPAYLRSAGNSFHSFSFQYKGTNELASVTGFAVSDDLIWFVGAVAPESDFLGGVRRSRDLAIAAGVAAVMLSVIVAWLMARRVSRPVVGMINFMHRVGAGELDLSANFAGSGEFRRLSEALNRMIADLRDRLRLRHSLNVAMEVQQRLLPSSAPNVPGLDIAGHSTYCDETGGDYYDFMVIESPKPGRLFIVVGDVMGHGVAAALVMAGVRAVLRDRAGDPGTLAELLTRLNRFIEGDLGGTRFMTMFTCVIDLPARTMRWASAGHDPAILYDPATDHFVDSSASGVGLPLGIQSDGGYEESTIALTPGMILLIGTDGIWEQHNEADEMFGKQRLCKIIQESASAAAEDTAERISEAVKDFRGQAPQGDDVTMVVVRVEGT